MFAAGLVLMVSCYAMKDRFTQSQRLNWGFMPTSGGSSWSDPAARSGVGTGDASIAAKDRPESFGAVDSEMFLESKELSLYDMFNEVTGEPMKLRTAERAQALNPENFAPSHERAAESEKGGGSFSTDRMPPDEHRHQSDAKDSSVVQWDGATGIRLAMHRYDTFDGSDWTQSADLSVNHLLRKDVGEDVWFFEPAKHKWLAPDPDSVWVGLLKVIRLDSNRLPVPMMTAGVHIKDIDGPDFYGIHRDGGLYMPPRSKVPPLTVVHVAGTTISEDELRAGLVCGPVVTSTSLHEIRSLAREVSGERTHAYDKLRAIVDHLRNEFSLGVQGAPPERTDEPGVSLRRFLRSRHGQNHLFATAAALMAREIGLQSRLVTGFYVRPDAFEVAAGHAAVLPTDVHVWAEVKLSDGRWFEIEPTPTFREPVYRPSIWLASWRFATTHWTKAAGMAFVLTFGWITRRLWMEWLVSLIWNMAAWLQPRHRLRLAIAIIETRARLVGQSRPVGRTQRDWIEGLTDGDTELTVAARQFCDAADALFFGHKAHQVKHSDSRLADLLNARTIVRLSREAAT